MSLYDPTDVGCMKIDQLVFRMLSETQLQEIAGIIEKDGIFRIETHDRRAAKTTYDPKLVIRNLKRNSKLLQLFSINLDPTEEVVDYYIEATHTIIRNVIPYLDTKKIPAYYMIGAIYLKRYIRNRVNNRIYRKRIIKKLMAIDDILIQLQHIPK